MVRDAGALATAPTASMSGEVGERSVARGADLDESGLAQGGLKLGQGLPGTEHPTELHEAHERVLARPGPLDHRCAAQLAARAQHAGHLGDRGGWVRKAVEARVGHDQVEAAVLEWQRL